MAAVEADAKASEAPAASGGGKKKLIMIVLLVVLVSAALAGGVAWFVAGSGTDTAHAEQAGGKAADGKDEKKRKKPAAPAIYYKLDPALVVNFTSNGVTRFLQVAIEISTRDPETAEALKQHDPVIRNDLLMLLGSVQDTTVSTREGKEGLRTQALEAVRHIVENEGGDAQKVEAVYFTSFVMQ